MQYQSSTRFNLVQYQSAESQHKAQSVKYIYRWLFAAMKNDNRFYNSKQKKMKQSKPIIRLNIASTVNKPQTN